MLSIGPVTSLLFSRYGHCLWAENKIKKLLLRYTGRVRHCCPSFSVLILEIYLTLTQRKKSYRTYRYKNNIIN